MMSSSLRELWLQIDPPELDPRKKWLKKNLIAEGDRNVLNVRCGVSISENKTYFFSARTPVIAIQGVNKTQAETSSGQTNPVSRISKGGL